MRRELVAGLAVATLSCGLEIQEAVYPDAPAARTAGAFERGWLPEVIPEDARDIVERHDLDTNETWACFTTPSGGESVRRKLVQLGAKRVSWLGGDGPGRPWWPDEMTRETLEAYAFSESGRLVVTVALARDERMACLMRRVHS